MSGFSKSESVADGIVEYFIVESQCDLSDTASYDMCVRAIHGIIDEIDVMYRSNILQDYLKRIEYLNFDITDKTIMNILTIFEIIILHLNGTGIAINGVEVYKVALRLIDDIPSIGNRIMEIITRFGLYTDTTPKINIREVIITYDMLRDLLFHNVKLLHISLDRVKSVLVGLKYINERGGTKIEQKSIIEDLDRSDDYIPPIDLEKRTLSYSVITDVRIEPDERHYSFELEFEYTGEVYVIANGIHRVAGRLLKLMMGRTEDLEMKYILH